LKDSAMAVSRTLAAARIRRVKSDHAQSGQIQLRGLEQRRIARKKQTTGQECQKGQTREHQSSREKALILRERSNLQTGGRRGGKRGGPKNRIVKRQRVSNKIARKPDHERVWGGGGKSIGNQSTKISRLSKR